MIFTCGTANYTTVPALVVKPRQWRVQDLVEGGADNSATNRCARAKSNKRLNAGMFPMTFEPDLLLTVESSMSVNSTTSSCMYVCVIAYVCVAI